MKTNETSTREQASEWFASKTYLDQHKLSDEYFESRHPSLLTIEQVEEIWRKETQEVISDEHIQMLTEEAKLEMKDYLNGEFTVKKSLSNQYYYSQVGRAGERQNQKQFKQFDESLFKAYINKFSDENKFKMLEVILRICEKIDKRDNIQ